MKPGRPTLAEEGFEGARLPAAPSEAVDGLRRLNHETYQRARHEYGPDLHDHFQHLGQARSIRQRTVGQAHDRYALSLPWLSLSGA